MSTTAAKRMGVISSEGPATQKGGCKKTNVCDQRLGVWVCDQTVRSTALSSEASLAGIAARMECVSPRLHLPTLT